jgi:hypothetical protein
MSLACGAALALLLAGGATNAAEPWIGRWAADAAGCKSIGDLASKAPLTVTDRSLNWFAGTCRIGKMYKIGNDAHIEAHCWPAGKPGTTPISLKPRGDRMAVVWDNAPAEEMRRCK